MKRIREVLALLLCIGLTIWLCCSKNTYIPTVDDLAYVDYNLKNIAQSENGQLFDQFETVETWRTNKPPSGSGYAKNSDKLFLMIKEGGSLFWQRMPIHMLTTLKRVPNFAIYSDSPGSIAGHLVVDALENVTQETLESREFYQYRLQRYVHDEHKVAEYADIKVNEGWDLDRFKNIPMLAHAYSVSPKSDWFVYMDGDSYFFFDNLMAYLDKLDPNEPLYLGSHSVIGKQRFAHGGSGVVLSRAAVEQTVGLHPEYVREYEDKTFYTCCGDFMVALMLKEKLGIEVSEGYDYPTVSYKFQGNPVWDLEFMPEKWCQPIMSFHHLTPHDVEVLWEYEQSKPREDRGAISWGQMYRDFVMPYIQDQLEGWDNTASDLNFAREADRNMSIVPASEGGKYVRPYESLDDCKAACEKVEQCLSYRYLPESNYCGLAGYFKLGRPTYSWLKQTKSQWNNTNAISGWMMDRINTARENSRCDPLHYK